MHSTSLHIGYPRSPFKFSGFINALLFLCHTSGLKLFPGGNVLLRPRSNAGLHSRYLLQPSTNAGLLLSSNAEMYPSSNAGLCPSSNAGLYPRCHRSSWSYKVEGVWPSLMLEMPSMEPATSVRALCQTASGVSIVVEHQRRTISEVVHHLGHGLTKGVLD